MPLYDIVWTIGGVLAVAALVVALSQLFHASFSTIATILWLLVIVTIAFVGALIWFAFGLRAARRRRFASQVGQSGTSGTY